MQTVQNESTIQLSENLTKLHIKFYDINRHVMSTKSSLLIRNLSEFIFFLLTTADETPKLSVPSLNCFVHVKYIYFSNKYIIKLNDRALIDLTYLLQTHRCDFEIEHHLIYNITESNEKLIIHIYPEYAVLAPRIQIIN